MKNCISCLSSYEPYKVGKDEDIGAYHCILPVIQDRKIKEPNGLCQFCNPKSILYVDKAKCYNLDIKCVCNKENKYLRIPCNSLPEQDKIEMWKNLTEQEKKRKKICLDIK